MRLFVTESAFLFSSVANWFHKYLQICGYRAGPPKKIADLMINRKIFTDNCKNLQKYSAYQPLVPLDYKQAANSNSVGHCVHCTVPLHLKYFLSS